MKDTLTKHQRLHFEGTARLPRQAWAPRWWPTWLVAAALYALGRLPYPLRVGLGSLLGSGLYRLMHRRRHIARRNLDYCLARLPKRHRERILRAQFRELGIAILETGATWSIETPEMLKLVRARGLENYEAALALGQGVLLVSGHFLPLNMALQLTTHWAKGTGIYRPEKNPVLDYLVHRGRERQGVRLISREDMRTTLRALRGGESVWFSPDQDHGISKGAFVPFFSRSAATVTTTARLAQRTGAVVIPLVYRRLPGFAGYELHFLPPLEGFPEADLALATRRINRFIERQAYLAPTQYLWLHRRFKTRPPGEASIYR